MIILFDVYMQEASGMGTVHKREGLHDLITDMKVFVSQKLNQLRNEIDKEELEDELKADKNKATIIWLLTTEKNYITFNGYSKDLTLKMVSCFSEDDLLYFLNKQSEFRTIRNN